MIVVTAEKLGLAELQKTPAAISVFTSAQLDKDKIVNIQDLVQCTPSMKMAQTTASPLSPIAAQRTLAGGG